MKIVKYIRLNESKKEVQFFAVGVIDENGLFNGIVHDSVGKGDYKERLVFGDKWIPEFNENGQPLDWDEQVRLFEELAVFPSCSITLDEIETELFKYVEYDTSIFNYTPLEEALSAFADGVLLEGMSLDDVDYGFGESVIEHGFKVEEEISFEEIATRKRINSFVKNLDNADCIRIGDSPLLEYWSVAINEEYDLISTSWNEDGLEYQFGLNIDNIEDVEFKHGQWLISTFGKNYQEKITFYKMETLGGES